jgi:3-isopropylmalate dehydrogenase
MKIAILPGDGIGKEVTAQAVRVLEATLGNSVSYELKEAPIGGAGQEAVGDALPPETLKLAQASDAILLGGTGIVEDETRPPSEGAGNGLLRLRKALTLFANYRPIFLFPELEDASSLKRSVVSGVDILMLRELNGDLYFGEPRGIQTNAAGEREGVNTMRYSESEIERIMHVAFHEARRRRRKVCSVDKSNVLETMMLWREVATRVGKSYSDVELTHLYVDAAVMHLVRDPRQFDVMVMGNVFGDILSDAAAMLTGSIGMLPSASLGDNRKGLYEPVHGTAPDIAGKNIANPLAAILSAAMMLRHSFDMEEHAKRIENAVRKVLAEGYRTADIMQEGGKKVGTDAMGEAVVSAVRANG